MADSAGTRDLIRQLRKQGFTITKHGNSRVRVTAPDGQTAIIPSPRARVAARAILNARAALRRIGANL